MIAYKMLAETYRKLLSEGKLSDVEDAKSHIKVYDFLSTCNKQDIEVLLKSGVFNEKNKSIETRQKLNDMER